MKWPEAFRDAAIMAGLAYMVGAVCNAGSPKRRTVRLNRRRLRRLRRLRRKKAGKLVVMKTPTDITGSVQ